METLTYPVDAPEWTLPPFSWSEPIEASTILNIAQLGDFDMRMNTAASPYLTNDAAVELLSLGDPRITAALQSNPVTPVALLGLARRPRRAAKAAKRVVARRKGNA